MYNWGASSIPDKIGDGVGLANEWSQNILKLTYSNTYEYQLGKHRLPQVNV